MSAMDYIPHGMVAAFASVVTFVFRQHTKQDDDRYTDIKTNLALIVARQQDISDTMASNHTEILKTLLESEQMRKL
jgi:hypothetical protein